VRFLLAQVDVVGNSGTRESCMEEVIEEESLVPVWKREKV